MVTSLMCDYNWGPDFIAYAQASSLGVLQFCEQVDTDSIYQ